MKTVVAFFPFDLFGSAGCGQGALLLADAVREMLADNRRETRPTRARAYQDHVRLREFEFETLADYADWRVVARKAVRQIWQRDEFLIWCGGNHLSALPLYDELSGAEDTAVVQFDAHLDVYNLADCTEELSHGNFLRHCAGALPAVLNLGHRDLFLPPDGWQPFFRAAWSAAELAARPAEVAAEIRRLLRPARRVLIDIDCDVLDPGAFPAVAQPQPFGLSAPDLLGWLDRVWSDRVIGVSVSEFDPARDQGDRSLATVVWLLEYLLLRRYELPGAVNGDDGTR